MSNNDDRPAPHTVPAGVDFPEPVADPADPRLKHVIQEWDGGPADIVLVGVPFDAGVAANGGRVGAARGPDMFRDALRRYGTTWDLDHETDLGELTLADAGNLVCLHDDIDRTHGRLTDAVAAVLQAGAVPVIVGGGNDLSFASVRALADNVAIGGINVDAHADVRPVVDGMAHSGTPYRRVLDELGVPGSRFVEFALHPGSNARAHIDWLRTQGAAIRTLDQVREQTAAGAIAADLERLAGACDRLFVSIDIDVFAACHAPGVSAPGTIGLTPEEGRSIALAAGRHPAVGLFELMEFNPHYDVDARTGRLCAMLFHAFCTGVALRRRMEG